jgi:hypothetical protein
MHLKALKHLASIASAISGEAKIVVFGSSSLLASYPEADTEYEMIRRSQDADFVLDPWKDEIALVAHDALGADSVFEEQNGYHADIIRPMAYENFPPGWESRAVPLPGCPGVICLEPHDMAVAKCFPARPKDRALIIALMQAGRLQAPVMKERLSSMPLTEAWIVKTHRFLHETAAEAGFPLPF